MNRSFKERVNCVCSKSVKIDDVIIVSKLVDKFDLRTKEERVYCRECPDGKKKASDWLLSRSSLGGIIGKSRSMER